MFSGSGKSNGISGSSGSCLNEGEGKRVHESLLGRGGRGGRADMESKERKGGKWKSGGGKGDKGYKGYKGDKGQSESGEGGKEKEKSEDDRPTKRPPLIRKLNDPDSEED